MAKYRRRKYQRRKPSWKKRKYIRIKKKKSFKRYMRSTPLNFKCCFTLDYTTDAAGKFKCAINSNGSPQKNNEFALFHYGVVANALTNPTAGTITEFTSGLQAIWSSCRLAAVKMKYIPVLPNEVHPNYYQPMYISYDPDGCEYGYFDMGTANMLASGNFKVKNICKPFNYYVKFPKRGIKNREWAPNQLTTVQGSENYAGAWHDIGNGTADCKAANANHIFFIGEGLKASTTYGTMIWTLYFCLRDRFL